MNISASTHTTLMLFGGVFGVLVLASAIGALLKWRVAHGQPAPEVCRVRVPVFYWNP